MYGKLISDILLGTPSHGRAKVGRPARTYINNSVLIQDVALKTNRKQWTIEEGCGRGSGRSVLMAWHEDDDDEAISKMCLVNAYVRVKTEKKLTFPEHFWLACMLTARFSMADYYLKMKSRFTTLNQNKRFNAKSGNILTPHLRRRFSKERLLTRSSLLLFFFCFFFILKT